MFANGMFCLNLQPSQYAQPEMDRGHRHDAEPGATWNWGRHGSGITSEGESGLTGSSAPERGNGDF